MQVEDVYTCQNHGFVRPPYCVLVKPLIKRGKHTISKTSLLCGRDYDLLLQFLEVKFFLMGFHSRPRDAREEIQRLGIAFDEVKKHFHFEGIILGDLNAGKCNVSRQDYSRLKEQLSGFEWFPAYDVKTNTHETRHCSYDR